MSVPRRCGPTFWRASRSSPERRSLPDELLDLHTDRQLVGLGAILERIEGDLRAAPVLAALRLALLHAILPSSRLATQPGRTGALRVSSGHVRPQSGIASANATRGRPSRNRSGWSAASSSVSNSGTTGPVQARIGEDLRSLGEGAATTVIALSGPGGLVALRDDPNAYGRTAPTPRVRLVIGQPPMRPSLDRLGIAYHGTSWVLGREAASLLPLDALAGGSLRVPWSWQTTAVAAALEAVEPSMARDGRVVQIVEAGPEAIVATVLGGATAGYRLVSARLSDADDDAAAIVELIPPGLACRRAPGRARTSASIRCRVGQGTRTSSPRRGCSAPRSGSTSDRSRRRMRPGR